MKKAYLTIQILLLELLFAAGSSMAASFGTGGTTTSGPCNKGSLIGAYSFEIMGASAGESEHMVGRIIFNGAGTASANAVDTSMGLATAIIGSGAYTVSTGCIATGSITWSSGFLSSFWIYLDQLDTSKTPAIAYHGSFAVKNNNGSSASGEINRVIGKF